MLIISEVQKQFVEDIFQFIKGLTNNKSGNNVLIKRSLFEKVSIVLYSFIDAIKLFLILPFRASEIVFIAPNLVNYETFLNEAIFKKVVFINYHHTKLIKNFSEYKVYNLGILVGIILKISNSSKDTYKTLAIANRLYGGLVLKLRPIRIYIPCFYDYVAFSLILSNKRNFVITEVQHGAINNFFPYTKPVPFQLVDEIWVNNERTQHYLENHLYKSVAVKIYIKPGESKKEVNYNFDKTILLYCSSIELNGLHPVILNFVNSPELELPNFKLLIRLHPREKSKTDIFRKQLVNSKINFDFDESNNWRQYSESNNLFVISPWSSMIEEAYESGIVSIIIDEFGRERFIDLIDDQLSFFSSDVRDVLENFKLKS